MNTLIILLLIYAVYNLGLLLLTSAAHVVVLTAKVSLLTAKAIVFALCLAGVIAYELGKAAAAAHYQFCLEYIPYYRQQKTWTTITISPIDEVSSPEQCVQQAPKLLPPCQDIPTWRLADRPSPLFITDPRVEALRQNQTDFKALSVRKLQKKCTSINSYRPGTITGHFSRKTNKRQLIYKLNQIYN